MVIKEKIATPAESGSDSTMSDILLFACTYRVGKREFLVEIFSDGSYLFYGESIRHFLSRAGESPQALVMEDIEADAPSPRPRKTEFAIRLNIDSEHLNLIREAREEFDQTDDVSTDLERQINSRFATVFSTDVNPIFSMPLPDL